MPVVHTMSLPTDYLARLIAKARGLQAQEGEVDFDAASNPTDDEVVDSLQDTPGDLTREELKQEIKGLNERQKAELVALLWVGRGDTEGDDWNAVVEMARERSDTPTAHYLLGEPLVGEYWAEGAERLGIDLPIDTTVELR